MDEVAVSNPEKLRFVILAPESQPKPWVGAMPTANTRHYNNFLSKVQKLRGNALREYCPRATGITRDGRHIQSADTESWHILIHDRARRVRGCARYRAVGGEFSQLGAASTVLAKSQTFGRALRGAIEDHIGEAHARNWQYGEVGGWVMSPAIRCSTAAINIALMTFVLAERLGGGMGLTTATTRHHSASMLRRLGGQRLAGLPPYYEPKYGCVIEILGFDMRALSNQFARKLNELRKSLDSSEIICRSETPHQVPSYNRLPFGYNPHALVPAYAGI